MSICGTACLICVDIQRSLWRYGYTFCIHCHESDVRADLFGWSSLHTLYFSPSAGTNSTHERLGLDGPHQSARLAASVHPTEPAVRAAEREAFFPLSTAQSYAQFTPYKATRPHISSRPRPIRSHDYTAVHTQSLPSANTIPQFIPNPYQVPIPYRSS